MTIVDTDILIDVARGDRQAILYLKNIQSESQAAITIITHMELVVGCRNQNEMRELDQFLQQFQIVPIHKIIAERALTLLQQFFLSHNLLIADALIAATAIEMDEPLASKNQRDFRYLPDLQLLPYPRSDNDNE